MFGKKTTNKPSIPSLQNLISLLDESANTIQSDEGRYKEIVKRDYADENARCDLAIKIEDLLIKQQRRGKCNQLSWAVLIISIVWLLFSGAVIVLIGSGILKFGDYSVITFIVGSLAEVFGLWKIALQYFFSDK